LIIVNVLEYMKKTIISRYLQKYYFGGGQKFMRISYNEWSLVKKYLFLIDASVQWFDAQLDQKIMDGLYRIG
jgi:hypothetical protein